MTNSQGFDKVHDYTQQNLTNLTYEEACRKAYGQWFYQVKYGAKMFCGNMDIDFVLSLLIQIRIIYSSLYRLKFKNLKLFSSLFDLLIPLLDNLPWKRYNLSFEVHNHSSNNKKPKRHLHE